MWPTATSRPATSISAHWKAGSVPLPSRCRICASVPGASGGSAISCCGSWPMPSCTSPICTGPISNMTPCARRWLILPAGSGVSARPASKWLRSPDAQATFHHRYHPGATGYRRLRAARFPVVRRHGRRHCQPGGLGMGSSGGHPAQGGRIAYAGLVAVLVIGLFLVRLPTYLLWLLLLWLLLALVLVL